MGFTWALAFVTWPVLWLSENWQAHTGIKAPPWADKPEPAYTFKQSNRDTVREFIGRIQAQETAAEKEQYFRCRRKENQQYKYAMEDLKEWTKSIVGSKTFKIGHIINETLRESKRSVTDWLVAMEEDRTVHLLQRITVFPIINCTMINRQTL
jgi:hypothetical protein